MPEADGDEMMEHLKKSNADIGDIFMKIWVNGDIADPLYKYLKHKQSGLMIDGIKWNFAKFLVNKNGEPVSRYGPKTDPIEIKSDIEALLKQ